MPAGQPAAAAGGDGFESQWLERSLFALDKFADRSVRGIQKFLFPEHSDAIAATQQELSMNTAMADLYEKGPLGRARRLRSASYSHPGASLARAPLRSMRCRTAPTVLSPSGRAAVLELRLADWSTRRRVCMRCSVFVPVGLSVQEW